MSTGDNIAAVGLPKLDILPASKGYEGSMFNNIGEVLKNTHLEHITLAVKNIFEEQHKQLTSDKPIIDSAFGMYAFAQASEAANYSPASAQQNSGMNGPSGGRFA